MRELREWLRAEPQRFPRVVLTFSVLGLVWVAGEAVTGFGLPAAGMFFIFLIALCFVYARDLQ